MINVGTCARDLKFLRCNVEHSLSSQAAAKNRWMSHHAGWTSRWSTWYIASFDQDRYIHDDNEPRERFVIYSQNNRTLCRKIKLRHVSPIHDEWKHTQHSTHLHHSSIFQHAYNEKNIANCVLSHRGKVSNFDFTYTSFHSSDLFNCRWNIWTVTQCKQFK